MANTITLKLEVADFDDKEARLIWYRASERIQELTNYIWRLWESHHTVNESSVKLRQLLDADARWRKTPKKDRGERPKRNLQPMSNELGKQIYHACAKRFPDLHSRVITLVQQNLRGNICSKKMPKGNLKWWQAILLDKAARGCCNHPQPIPFDRSNNKILESDERGRVRLEVRVDRIFDPSKKKSPSTPIAFSLRTDGKRWKYASLAHAAARGEIALRGSQLVYDHRKKKWYACLVVDSPASEPVDLDENKVAVLRPGLRNNWTLRVDGKTLRIGGRGNYVSHVRKGLLMQRWSRQSGYRNAPTRKGRGKNRALTPLFKLQRRWLNMTKRMNDELTRIVLDICCDRGAGKIILVGGDSSRRLATAGKVEGREDSTGWPWYQVENILGQKANRIEGMTVVKRAFCGRTSTTKAVGAKASEARGAKGG